MRGFSLGDILFLIFLFFSTIGITGLLYSDMSRLSQASNEKVIGTITFKQKVAQRKYTGQVVWENLEQSTELRNKDSIRTSQLSEAEITLNDGTKITLDENSMILLNINDGQTELDFAYGTLSTKQSGSDVSVADGNNATALKIKVGDKTINSEGDVNLSGSKDGSDMQLKLESGTASVSSTKGEEISVSKNEIAKIGGENLSVATQSIQLQLPTNLERKVIRDSKTQVNFQWIRNNTKNSNSKLPSNLIISSYPDLKSPWKVISTSDNQAKVDVPVGSHYFAVRLGTETTETRRFTIYQNAPVALNSPANGSKISTASNNSRVSFIWGKATVDTTYILEIANSQDMNSTSIVNRESLSANSFSKELSVGSYYWRIGTKDPIGDDIVYSKVYKFEIVREETLVTPQLMQPETKTKFALDEVQKSGLTFTWTGSKIADSYQFTLVHPKTGSAERESKSASIQWKENLDVGRYRWSVAAIRNNSKSEPSEIREFEIVQEAVTPVIEEAVLVPPSLVSPIQNSEIDMTQKDEIRFIWKTTNAKQSRLELAPANRLSQLILKLETNDNFYTFRELNKLEEGEFVWRVVSIHNNGQESISKDQKFRVVLNRGKGKLEFTSPKIYYVE
ncbi:FecR domain-containing protein [Leptospira sp. GIMC2001]|uniref:FecR domain-containing protein n=1 Tax=Leptospira sp. GIMC2001 TaxID=1513297 RepID=UPI002349C151|nr:FecR domain-containing protein [Leptospira sp. GIMC2001]WCL47574.1 FecR domain-containing protein [Leptospira sp. GIMC2001]